MNCNRGVINMLAVNKVKLHGMTSSKWTPKDKLTQYKGIINLYTRDRKIIEADSEVFRKRLKKEVHELQKNVQKDRLALDNAVGGDKQSLRNAMAEHREMQLAYRDTPPEKVTEYVEQLVFDKRKLLDKLIYQNNLKAKKLIDLKLETADMKELVGSHSYNIFEKGKNNQILAGKVQDAILRKEAAIAIKQIYVAILDIMKKDALYYDSIITTLECDGYGQSKCILAAIKLGQLATEYLDDRKQEFKELEQIVLQDMAVREYDIKVLEEKVNGAATNIKNLMGRESDVNTCHMKLPFTSSMEALRKEIANIEKTLKYLKDVTSVPSYEAIYPCLEQQQKQKRRLQTMLKRCQRNRDILQNKLNHAELMRSVLDSTNIVWAGEYNTKTKELVSEMNILNKKIKDNETWLKFRYNLAATIGIALRHLLELSNLVKSDVESTKRRSGNKAVFLESFVFVTSHVKEPEEPETDAREILKILNQRLKILMPTYFQDVNRFDCLDEAYTMYEVMMNNQIAQSPVIKRKSGAPGLERDDFIAQPCLTREDIKKQSAELVSANMINPDTVPVYQSKRKSKFQFKK